MRLPLNRMILIGMISCLFIVINSCSDSDDETTLIMGEKYVVTTDIGEASGLAFDGSNIWCTSLAGYQQDNLFKIDLSANIINSYCVNVLSSEGLAFDGTYFWSISFTGDLIKIDTQGHVIEHFEFLDDHGFAGLTFDGTFLWSTLDFGEKLLKLDTSGNMVEIYTLQEFHSISGLSFDGTHLWGVDYLENKLCEIDLSGNVVNSLELPPEIESLYFYDLAYDGSYFWVAAYDIDGYYLITLKID